MKYGKLFKKLFNSFPKYEQKLSSNRFSQLTKKELVAITKDLRSIGIQTPAKYILCSREELSRIVYNAVKDQL